MLGDMFLWLVANLKVIYFIKQALPQTFHPGVYWSSLAPKWPIPVPFYGMVHQKSNFHWYMILFLLEAVEASRCNFFENWLMKHKCPTLLKPLATVIQQNYWSFYPSEPFTFTRHAMRHPVLGRKISPNPIKVITNFSISQWGFCYKKVGKKISIYVITGCLIA